MTRSSVDRLNLVGALVALAAAIALAVPDYAGHVEMPSSTQGTTLLDATSTSVSLRPFTRIASASTVADQILAQLAEPERVVAITEQSKQTSLATHFPRTEALTDLSQLEQILQLRPDLVLVNNVGNVGRVQRLRDAGLTVFDLGAMTGVDALLDDMRTVARLLGIPERGEAMASQFREQIRSIARDVPTSKRRSAMYLGIHTDKLFGGTRGSNYHDVLHYAGLIDVAAKKYSGWPPYSAETVLALNPDLVVTQQGMPERICQIPGLAQLQPCQDRSKFVEVDAHLLSDPGLGMLDAARAVHHAVYGD